MAIAPQRSEIGIRRHFTTAGIHPYDEVQWERRDARITNYRDGTVAFEQLGVEVPESWSLNATNILAQKYFRGTLNTPERESSLKQVADRVADTVTAWGLKDGYFVDEEEAEIFNHELKHLIIHQKAAFNSPVWFNIGVPGVPQQGSACQPFHALVSTPDGPVPIGRLVEENAIGRKVFDADGITRIVAVKHNGTKPVLRIHTKAGHQLDVTGDHLVWKASAERYGKFVPAADLRPEDKLTWHRRESFGSREIVRQEIAEAALAGWLQSDGFVGQYTGTNRSLTIEAMTVTEAERQWVLSAIDSVFGDTHRHERLVKTLDQSLDCRRNRLYGVGLTEFVEKWDLRTRGLDMTVPDRLYEAPLPVVTAYLRSVFQAEGYVVVDERSAYVGLDMISEGVVRGLQTLLSRYGIFSRVRRKEDPRANRKGCWSLSIRTLGDRVTFANEIGFIDPTKEEKLLRSLELEGHPSLAAKRLEITCIEEIGVMDVYDIQTESGEYLSGDFRVHNCFILAVEDQMDSILNWYTEEGIIFKGGSGAGVNLSKIRSSHELLKGGGTASGPVSFMRGADASAGTIKSGGKTRRAAKMVILDIDHPDVEDFVWCKAIEERKARVLRDAGFDMDLDGADSHSTQYQNANNSVRVTDEFMEAVIDDREWHLTARTDGSVVRTVPARDLFRQIAHSAWECADPGLQYDTTINRWHTAPLAGKINGSNPCAEYLHLDNSACNLASMNLLKFLNENDEFDVEGFKAGVSVMFTGQEIIVGNADYPTEKIAENTRAFRELGIGYANLGALLMAQGLPYDSDAGRAWAGAITALLTGHGYATSARTAARMGPFSGFHDNAEAMIKVLRMHQAEAARIDEEVVPPELLSAAQESWDEAVELAEQFGVRNSQCSTLAPTGTIGLLMDCDTTGVEPDLGLVKTKKLVGGGTMSIVNQTIPRALVKLGYGPDQVAEIVMYINEHMSILGAPHIAPEHLAGLRLLHGRQHHPLLGAHPHDGRRPALHQRWHFQDGQLARGRHSGGHRAAAHRCVAVGDQGGRRLPGQLQGGAAAVDHQGGRCGDPASRVATVAPPGSSAEAKDRAVAARIAELEAALLHEQERKTESVVVGAIRERLPRRRNSKTFAFRVADCEGYVTVGEYEDGRPGEVFINVSKQGSTLAGIMDAFSISLSLGLQHQVPLATYVRKYTNMKFEPAGITDDPELRIATSLVDYIFRRIALDYLSVDERTELGILSTSERMQPTLPGVEEMATPSVGLVDDGLGGGAAVPAAGPAAGTDAVPHRDLAPPSSGGALGNTGIYPIARAEQRDAPYCYSCGNAMQRAGSCYVCGSCGTTSGCS